jgi:hypothetical protein
MEWELLKPWVNRVGILLEFLSFWFASRRSGTGADEGCVL